MSGAREVELMASAVQLGSRMLGARAVSVGLGVVSSLLLLAVGCSGASAPEIPAVVTDTSTTEPLPGDVTESIPSYAPAADPSADPPSDDPPPAPAPPPPCAEEAEPNDSVAKSTAFTTCIGGTLTDSRDRDFLSIVAPPNVRRMTIVHEEAAGKVQYRVGQKAGSSVDFDETFTGEAPAIAVKAGATYVFRLAFASGGSKAARPWELTVTFE